VEYTVTISAITGLFETIEYFFHNRGEKQGLHHAGHHDRICAWTVTGSCNQWVLKAAEDGSGYTLINVANNNSVHVTADINVLKGSAVPSERNVFRILSAGVPGTILFEHVATGLHLAFVDTWASLVKPDINNLHTHWQFSAATADGRVRAEAKQKLLDEEAALAQKQLEAAKIAEALSSKQKQDLLAQRVADLEASMKSCCSARERADRSAQEAMDKLAAQQQKQEQELAALLAQTKRCCEERESAVAKQKQFEDRIAKLEQDFSNKSPQGPAPTPTRPPGGPTPVLWPPAETPAKVLISYIHFVGAQKGAQGDEFIEIKNIGGKVQDISGWVVRAGSAAQEYKFPKSTVLDSGATARVYTNFNDGKPGSYSFGVKRAIWNDAGDHGELLDVSGVVVSSLGYGSRETRSLESIKANYGIEKMRIEYTMQQLAEPQNQRGKIDFLTAVERAVRSLLHDPWDQGNPNAAEQVRSNWEGVPRDADMPVLEMYIRAHMNREELRLLSEDSWEKGDLAVSTKDAWVFLLQRGMGDLHWVVIQRNGAEPAYQSIT
jgi:hypothetical protein